MSLTTMSVKSVAICDTEPIAIEGMRALLNASDDLQLAAAETSLLGGMEMVRQYSPAVIILDKTFGIHAIMDCLKRLRASGFTIAPVVWGLNLSEAEALRMLQAGHWESFVRQPLRRRCWNAFARRRPEIRGWRLACFRSRSDRCGVRARI
jgi:DNA-binding NarL/FixJ family response regulator